MKINWGKYLSQYDVVYEQQSRVWQDGTPLGNGSLAAKPPSSLLRKPNWPRKSTHA